MKILCLGHATWDVVIPVTDYPIENTKNRIDKCLECGGGPASNAAYLLGKWGMDVSFAGVVGDDQNGRKINQEFASDNVNTFYLQTSNDHITTSSYIIVNTSNGSRTTLSYHPSNLRMDTVDIKENFDYLLIDGQEYEMSKYILDNYDLVSVIDAGRVTDEVIDLCKKVNYVVCSKDFAEGYTKESCDNLDLVLKKLNEDFKGEVIITLEDKGCAYLSDEVKVIPTIKVKAVDSTGAGDIFHGAFVYGLTQGWDIEKILFFANITGSLSVTRLCGRNSIFPLDDVRSKANEISRSNFY